MVFGTVIAVCTAFIRVLKPCSTRRRQGAERQERRRPKIRVIRPAPLRSSQSESNLSSINGEQSDRSQTAINATTSPIPVTRSELFSQRRDDASAPVARPTNPRIKNAGSPVSINVFPSVDVAKTQDGVDHSVQRDSDETFDSEFHSEHGAKKAESQAESTLFSSDDGATSVQMSIYNSLCCHDNSTRQCSDDKFADSRLMTAQTLTDISLASSPDSLSSNDRCSCPDNADTCHKETNFSLTSSHDSLSAKNKEPCFHGNTSVFQGESDPVHRTTSQTPSLDSSATDYELGCHDNCSICSDSKPYLAAPTSSSLSTDGSSGLSNVVSTQTKSLSILLDSASNTSPTYEDSATSMDQKECSEDEENESCIDRQAKVFECAREKGICLEDMKLTVDGCGIMGTIIVQNDKFEKCVGVRCTDNEWLTYQDISAEWMETTGEGKFDRFKFLIPVPELGDYKMELAFFYDNFWDNNNGLNHLSSRTIK